MSPNQSSIKKASGSRTASDMGGISLPRASLSMMSLASENNEARFRSESDSPKLHSGHSKTASGGDPFMELLFSGWNPDLPDPSTLNH